MGDDFFQCTGQEDCPMCGTGDPYPVKVNWGVVKAPPKTNAKYVEAKSVSIQKLPDKSAEEALALKIIDIAKGFGVQGMTAFAAKAIAHEVLTKEAQF